MIIHIQASCNVPAMPEILQIHLENLFNDPNTHKWDGWRQPDIKKTEPGGGSTRLLLNRNVIGQVKCGNVMYLLIQ